MQKQGDSFANHLSANLQAQKPHCHPWDNHSSSGGDTATEEGDLATIDVALRPLLPSTATTVTPSSLPPGDCSSTALLAKPIGTTAFSNYRQQLKNIGPYELRCEVLDNRQGKIIIDGALTIYCRQLQSANGMIAATGPIHIVCHEFCNSNGVVQSHVGAITITSRYALCNQQGQLLAQSDITLTNPHSRFDNSQGSIISQGSLQITGDTLTNQGQITGESVDLTLKEPLINGPAGAIQAAKKLDVITSHDCHNEGNLQAGQQIKLQAPVIENHPKGVIEAKETQLLTSNAGECINQGLIDGQMTEIRANTISNLEGGRLYGDEILLATETLVNHSKESNSKPIIAARQKLTIGAQKIVNQAGALIMSGGSMRVGGQLDEQQRLSGSSGLLDNLSATIDIQGEGHFQVATVNNRDIFFSTQSVAVSSTRYRQMQRDGDTVRVPINDETLRNFTDASYTVYDYYRTASETAIQQQSPAQLLVGQNLALTGILNNDKSRVMIGGKLSGSMKSINHIDAFGNRVIKEQGTTQFTYTDWVRDNAFFGTTQFKRIWQSPVSYQVEVENSRYPLKLTVEQQNKSSISPSYSIAQRTQTAISPLEKPVALTLSLAPLFRINRDNPHQPLVSSDPRLFNYREALGLSGLVNPFSSDSLPRLCGDVGYQQQLIREQLMAFTGQRFLPGYRNDTEQQVALLNQGAKAAKTLCLIPGTALTAEQQQHLTEDIIWPVKQPIMLETGEAAEVLIPKLYVHHSFPKPIGTAMITANDIELSLSEKLNSSGTLLAKNHCQISAKSVDNQGMMAAAVTQLTAQRSIVQRGLVVGEQSLLLQAGRDIHLPSTLNTSESKHGSGSHCLHTTLGERARLLVTQPEGVMSLQAKRDIDLSAAQVLHTGEQGHTLFSAGRNLTVGAATVGYQQRIQQQPNDYLIHSRYQEIGSQIKVAGTIHCQANNDFQAIASEISSGIPVNQNDTNGNPLTALENSQETDGALCTATRKQQKIPTLTIQAGHHLTTRGGKTTASSIRKGHFAASLEEQKVETPCQFTSHQPQGHLQLAAQSNIDLKATQLQQRGRAGDTTVVAGNDIKLGTQANHQRQYVEYAQGYISRGRQDVAGNQIQSTGAAKILAGHNLTAIAVEISSGQADKPTDTPSSELSLGNEPQEANQGDLHLLAGNQLTIASAPTHHYFYQKDSYQRQQSLAPASLTNQASQATLAIQAD